MSHIQPLCARIVAAADHIKNRHPNDTAIEQALQDLYWAAHNVRNQNAALEQEHRDQQQQLAWALQEIERLQAMFPQKRGGRSKTSR